MLLTLSLLKRYSHNIKELFSTTEKIQLSWLRNLTYIVTFVLVFFLIENSLLFADVKFFNNFDFTSLLAAISVYIMGYMGLFKSAIFAERKIAESIIQLSNYSHQKNEMNFSDHKSAEKKYERSGLNDDKIKIYLQELKNLMNEDNLYQDCDLTLQQLANKLRISSHNLSQIINTQLNQNFFDFVNQYRVEKVKVDLLDPKKEHMKILSIGLDAGFNSKSSFNTIFKKHTKMTPSEYRKKILQSQN